MQMYAFAMPAAVQKDLVQFTVHAEKVSADTAAASQAVVLAGASGASSSSSNKQCGIAIAAILDEPRPVMTKRKYEAYMKADRRPVKKSAF